jgi:phage terminase large subunit-like protein
MAKKKIKDFTLDDWKKVVEKCQSDVYFFAKFFFPNFLKAQTPSFHLEIYNDLPKYPFIAREAFRGGAKSTIGLIIYPMWHSLFKHTGDISLISRSENFVLNEIARRIRFEFENNERLKLLFGNLKTDKWSESYFTLKNGISFESKGIEGQLRGGRRALIALDDLEDNESVVSEEQRDKLRQRISKELIPKLIPGGQIIYFGTPIHPLCYLHQIITTPDNGWNKKVYDAYSDGIEEEGHEAWKEMLPHSELQHRKSIMGSNYFFAEYRCKPVSDEKMPIKEEQIRYWKELPQQYSAVITVDPAYSEDESADYKVASMIAIDQNANRYLLHYIRTHNSLNDFINAVLTLWQSNKNTITAIGVPNSGTEKSFFETFCKLAEAKKLYPPIVELKNSFISANTTGTIRNKRARIVAALQPLFEQGKYFLGSEHLEAKDELLTIGVSRWDDIVDTMTYAEQLLQPVYFDTKGIGFDYQEEQSINHGSTGYGDY